MSDPMNGGNLTDWMAADGKLAAVSIVENGPGEAIVEGLGQLVHIHRLQYEQPDIIPAQVRYGKQVLGQINLLPPQQILSKLTVQASLDILPQNN
jgi:hypothetical protein